MYVICSKKGKKFNGQIANTVFQITSEPPIIAVSVNRQNLTNEFIKGSGVFTVSILLKETPMRFIGSFGFRSGRELDKLKGVKYKIGITGVPVVLEHSTGYLEAEVINAVDVGTHTVFIGKVVDAEIIDKKGEPMTYAYYHEIKRGRTPKTAPTYITEKEEDVKKINKYRCTICGYIYDPEKGDPDSGIKPRTSFEELPDDWVCPVCGASKDAFEEDHGGNL